MKIGVVPYLNALPLYHFLDQEVLLETPVKLTQMMETGDLDLALLPVFSYFQHPEWHIIPEAGGIISSGPVESVLIFYKKHIEKPADIKTIQYTSDSKTSVGLTKVLRHFFWKAPPLIETTDHPDAILEIGDRALTFDHTGYQVIDLGEIWTNWTKLPFVYAAWISRKPLSEDIKNQLIQSKEKGLKNIKEIIDLDSPISQDIRKPYLTKSIQYDLTPEALEGMKLYQDYLSRLP